MIDQHERAHAIAASRIQALIVDMVREVHGDDAIERRQRYAGDKYPEPVPTPLAGLQAADWVVQRAGQEIHQHVHRAREAGHSWEQIGQALDMRPVDGRSVAESAYERLAGPPASWPLQGTSFTWRCPACDRVSSDRGPYESHPDDNQPGHAKDCPRLATELARWRASWDDTPDGRDMA
jgi:hypothetical protein